MFDPSYQKQTNLFFGKNTLSLKNNIFDVYDAEENEIDLFDASKSFDYNSVIPKDSLREDRRYIRIFFRADNERKVYTLESYDLVTMVGDLGGLLDIILIVGQSLTSFLTALIVKEALVD